MLAIGLVYDALVNRRDDMEGDDLAEEWYPEEVSESLNAPGVRKMDYIHFDIDPVNVFLGNLEADPFDQMPIAKVSRLLCFPIIDHERTNK